MLISTEKNLPLTFQVTFLEISERFTLNYRVYYVKHLYRVSTCKHFVSLIIISVNEISTYIIFEFRIIPEF